MTRPSSRCTHRLSSSKRTALAEVLIPRPFDQFAVELRDLGQFTQRGGIEAGAVGHTHLRFEPQLGFGVPRAHKHVHRLARVSFIGVEEETEPLVAEDDPRAKVLGRRLWPRQPAGS